MKVAAAVGPHPSPAGPPLGREFFERDPVEVARSLIGCVLDAGDAGGVIVETEAYRQDDPASHSHRGPRGRARVMFGPAGHLYVYRSYGLHWCVNLVCDAPGRGSAVLLRALEPTVGIERMRERRPGRTDRELCSGPGRLTTALGIDATINGGWAVPGPDGRRDLVLLPRAAEVAVARGPRIGITREVDRPWRYAIAGSRWLSKPMGQGVPA